MDRHDILDWGGGSGWGGRINQCSTHLRERLRDLPDRAERDVTRGDLLVEVGTSVWR